MIASVVRPVQPFRAPFFSKIAIDTPLDTGPERLGEEEPPFHKKQEPLEIYVKINRGFLQLSSMFDYQAEL